MNAQGWLQIALYLAVLAALTPLLGGFMARVYAGEPTFLGRLLGPFERRLYRWAGVAPDEEMSWQRYAGALLAFNALGFVAVYLLQRLQGVLPLNPAGLPGTSAHLAFNTAVSFASNTNWQSYGGETTMSFLTQMLGLTVQNFVSAATGMAVLVALVRGITRRETVGLGSFWVDLTRGVLYILLPLSLVLALALVSQGVVQTFTAQAEVTAVAGGHQTLALGPAASQVAIKQLGTNGGGFFNVNSAHPLENPTPLSGFLELLAILLIPSALCATFGRLVGDRRQGWALWAAMAIAFTAMLSVCYWAEARGNPALGPGLESTAGNLEGKEVRFGIANSALWATATTAASNGSVNAMHDSFTPLGGLVPMVLMQLGEVIFGGVGSGLYGLLLFVVVAVFIAGLMVGRTPEYLGKKIEAHEMKMAMIGLLVPPILVVCGTAIAVLAPAGLAGLANPGAHGFSEILYAFSSAGNNNGSAFAGLSANTPFYNLALGVAMLFARYWVALPVLAIAGSLARKRFVPVSAGTLPTHTPLFVVLLLGTVVLLGALAFLPALALGPIVEHLQLP
jgi:K+-transporting ATPase ATPase A chain